MPDEAMQGYRASADRAAVRALQNLEAPELAQALALGSIAVSLIRIGDLLEKWAQPRLAILPEAGPPEEEKVWYVGKSSITNEAWPGLKGPFTKAEAIQRLREKGHQ